MMKKNPHDILVIQLAGVGSHNFIVVVGEYLKLEQNVDFRTFGTAFMIEKHLYPNKPQLLITGTISENVEDVYEFVRMMRKKKNSQLVVVGYSARDLDADHFDRVVKKKKSTSNEEIVQAIQDFRNGTLRHNPV